MDQAQALRDLANKAGEASIQTITVTSAKGGVGKSSVAVNLAIALTKRGKRVLIVDMDLGLANIDLMLGVKTRYNLFNAIEGSMNITDIIEKSSSGVLFISGGSGLRELIKLPPAYINRIISDLLNLRDIADIMIFDTGSGISDYIVRLACASHATWLVTTPEPTAMMDAYALIKQIAADRLNPNIQLILNKADNSREAKAAVEGFIQISSKYTGLKVNELGSIPRDPNMVSAVKKQEPLLISYPNSIASHAIGKIADKVINSEGIERTGFDVFLNKLFGKSIS